MDISQIILQLELEWDVDGFFYAVRNGCFDEERGQRVLELLRHLTLDRDALLPRRLVSLFWYMPQFLEWQIEGVAACGGNRFAYEGFANKVLAAVEDILGTP